jgi:hypothetical protein
MTPEAEIPASMYISYCCLYWLRCCRRECFALWLRFIQESVLFSQVTIICRTIFKISSRIRCWPVLCKYPHGILSMITFYVTIQVVWNRQSSFPLIRYSTFVLVCSWRNHFWYHFECMCDSSETPCLVIDFVPPSMPEQKGQKSYIC